MTENDEQTVTETKVEIDASAAVVPTPAEVIKSVFRVSFRYKAVC